MSKSSQSPKCPKKGRSGKLKNSLRQQSRASDIFPDYSSCETQGLAFRREHTGSPSGPSAQVLANIFKLSEIAVWPFLNIQTSTQLDENNSVTSESILHTRPSFPGSSESRPLTTKQKTPPAVLQTHTGSLDSASEHRNPLVFSLLLVLVNISS